jgi:hypothetical protein
LSFDRLLRFDRYLRLNPDLLPKHSTCHYQKQNRFHIFYSLSFS